MHYGHTGTDYAHTHMNTNTYVNTQVLRTLSLVLSSPKVSTDVYTLMCKKLKHLLFLLTSFPPSFFSFSESGIPH